MAQQQGKEQQKILGVQYLCLPVHMDGVLIPAVCAPLLLPCEISLGSITSQECVPPGIPQIPTVPQTDRRVCCLWWSVAL